MSKATKLFQLVQEIYQKAGICSSQSNQNFPLNSKILFVLFAIVQLFISSTAFLLFKAKSFEQHADAFYLCLSEFASIVIVVGSNWKITQIEQLTEGFQEFIEKSKCNVSITDINHLKSFFRLTSGSQSSPKLQTFYMDLVAKIERMTQLVHFALVELTFPGVLIPALLITVINFFIYDLGDKSFFLPFFVMYVRIMILFDFSGLKIF